MQDGDPVAAGYDARLLVVFMATGSLAAGAIHLAVISEHLAEYRPFGWFFIGVGIFQIGWPVLLATAPQEPDRRLVAVGVAANAALVVLWLAARTSGLPLGPEPWEAESFGLADSVSALFEVVVVAAGALFLAGYRLNLKRAAAIAVATVAVSGVLTAVALDTLAPEAVEMEMMPGMEH